MGNRHSQAPDLPTKREQSQYNSTISFEGACARCGAPFISVGYRDRRGLIHTCTCEKDTLNHLLNVILNVLDETITEPRMNEAKQELVEFLEEFGEWKD